MFDDFEDEPIVLVKQKKERRKKGKKVAEEFTRVTSEDGEYSWMISKEDAVRLTDEQIRHFFSVHLGKLFADGITIVRGEGNEYQSV